MKQSIFLPSTSELTTEDITVLNKTFCELANIRPVVCAVCDKTLNITHFYSNISGVYKRPKDITEYRIFSFKNNPLYPDLVNNSNNFVNLLNVQWKQSGQIGTYTQTHCESFSVNYLTNKLTSIIMVSNRFINNNLESYLHELSLVSWDYDITKRLDYEISSRCKLSSSYDKK